MSMYVTVAQLATHLAMTTALTPEQVEMFERAIGTASAQIDGMCGRTFSAASEQRFFTPLTGNLADLGYVHSISAIDLDETTDYTYATPLLSTDYILSPGKRKFLTLKTIAPTTLPAALNSIRVTGIFGELAPPIDIQEACILQSARLWKRKDAVFGEIRSDNGFMRIQGHFDTDAKQILRDGGWLKTSRMVIV